VTRQRHGKARAEIHDGDAATSRFRRNFWYISRVTRARRLALLFGPALALAPDCTRSAREPQQAREPARPDAGSVRLDGGVPAPIVVTIPMKSVVAVALPADAACRHAAGKALRGASGECARDEDCLRESYGRCAPVRGQNACVYDECVADSECERRAAGTLCVCAGEESEVNRCRAGNCRADSDCAPGEACRSFHCAP
jgi:hypothetical protein